MELFLDGREVSLEELVALAAGMVSLFVCLFVFSERWKKVTFPEEEEVFLCVCVRGEGLTKEATTDR